MRNRNNKTKTVGIIAGIFLVILTPSIYLIAKHYPPQIVIAVATAIATTAMAIFNFLLEEQRTAREESLRREINEKIYSKLHPQLKAFLIPELHTREDIQTMALPMVWLWDSLKAEEYHLPYQLPKKIFNQLEKFTQIFTEYEKCFALSQKEIKMMLLDELKIINSDTFLEMRSYFQTQSGGWFYKMIENLYLLYNIEENVKKFKAENKIGTDLRVEFLDGTRKILLTMSAEQEVIQFFEKLFRNIRENSENFRKLLRLRKLGMELANQLLEQISPR